ncbi:MAG: archaellin/type IV pilin N-terminal domain-containing protein [Nanoarchaeota archaeon]
MKGHQKKRRKGVSPLIASVLLIGFTVTITSLIIIWGRTFTAERADKEQAISEAQLNCNNLDFTVTSADYSSGALTLSLGIKNKGMTTIDSFVFRINEGAAVIESGEKVEGIQEKTVGIEDASFSGIPSISQVEIIPKIRVARNYYIPCSTKSRVVDKVASA